MFRKRKIEDWYNKLKKGQPELSLFCMRLKLVSTPHQALLTDRVLNAQGGDWGICEISLFSGDQLMSQLRAQNHLYTVLEKGADGNQVIIVGAVHECLNAKLDSLAAIIEKFCEPQVAIVSLTITEKGYCIDPATGALDTSNPRIIHDLQTPEEPHSAPGILVEAINGSQLIAQGSFTPRCWLISTSDSSVAAGTMRSTMVPGKLTCSFIHPASSGERFSAIPSTAFFTTWPLSGILSQESMNDVLPWEEMKLRMLNGSHSFLAYLGYLSGFAHISDCMQDRAFRHAARTLMLDEQAPTLQIKDVDLTFRAPDVCEYLPAYVAVISGYHPLRFARSYVSAPD